MRVLPGAAGATAPRRALEKSYSAFIGFSLRLRRGTCRNNADARAALGKHNDKVTTKAIDAEGHEARFATSRRIGTRQGQVVLKNRHSVRCRVSPDSLDSLRRPTRTACGIICTNVH